MSTSHVTQATVITLIGKGAEGIWWKGRPSQYLGSKGQHMLSRWLRHTPRNRKVEGSSPGICKNLYGRLVSCQLVK